MQHGCGVSARLRFGVAPRGTSGTSCVVVANCPSATPTTTAEELRVLKPIAKLREREELRGLFASLGMEVTGLPLPVEG